MNRADAAWTGGGAGPLAGVRVLDLSRVLAGPLATMQLGDLGADVIKIETPDGGDVTRHWPPFLPDGTATYYTAINRNKRSVVLDLGSPPGRVAAQALAGTADVLVHNFLPGRLARFGLEPDALRRGNPGLVTANVSGFGSDSPSATRPGFDFLAQAMGGVMAMTGTASSGPNRMGVAIVDIAAGMQLTQGILAALYERSATGRGRQVEVALLDSAAFLLMNLAQTNLLLGQHIARFGNMHPSIAPYETLPVADGEIAVAVGTDRQFARLVDALGAPELADDPRFRRNRDRVLHRPELREKLGALFATATRAEWLERLVSADVPAAPVNEIAEALADPIIRDRAVADVGGIAQVRGPVRIDGVPLPMRLPPPELGADTADVLAALGLVE